LFVLICSSVIGVIVDPFLSFNPVSTGDGCWYLALPLRQDVHCLLLIGPVRGNSCQATPAGLYGSFCERAWSPPLGTLTASCNLHGVVLFLSLPRAGRQYTDRDMLARHCPTRICSTKHVLARPRTFESRSCSSIGDSCGGQTRDHEWCHGCHNTESRGWGINT
jgi:hypothetical protein